MSSSSDIVAVVACRDYRDAPESIRRAYGLVMGNEALPGGEALIKPNLLRSSSPSEAVVTHASIVGAAAGIVTDAGYQALLGDSPGWGSARAVAERAGYMDALAGLDIPIIDFGKGRRFGLPPSCGARAIYLAREAVEADLILNLPKLKNHVQMTMTGAVKNLFGCVVGKRKPLHHLLVHNSKEAFARMLLAIHSILPRSITIMDAVEVMEGNGPSAGSPRRLGAILAGRNPSAVDLVAARMMGYSMEEIPTLALAVKTGILDPSNVTTLGDDPDSFIRRDLVRPEITEISFTAPRVLFSAIKGVLLRLREG